MPRPGLIDRFATLRALGVALVFCIIGVTLMPASPALAFQDAEKPAGEEGATPAADAGDGAAEVDPGEKDAAKALEEKSFLMWMIEASGVFGLLILLLSFIMVALIMMNILSVRRDNFVPQSFIEAFEARLNAKDYQGAYNAAREDESLVARVLAAGLSKLNQGYDKAVEGMNEVGDDENMALEHRLSYLALISAIAPMLGLMGTVAGMIASFREIATSPTTPKPSELADGISTALFTTLEGLTVAIPAMVFYALLRNRIARFLLEVSMVSESLMGRFAQTGKTGGAPAAAAAAPPQQ
ncbi:MAG: MotA/TolQ/ExbB proton channel family protein [Planctomycetota bacterium]|nr:MotA/TolQ/ExbB proton channel family protein [Planctomycetota bacterium]MDA1248732.1 MotA/TolQ/ExbB proton channel family protein [Planctomycetota bacterium]